MFVNKITFFVTISRHIQFLTTEILTGVKIIILIQSVVNMNIIYKGIGFRISTPHVNVNFATVRIKGAVVKLNVTFNPVP